MSIIMRSLFYCTKGTTGSHSRYCNGPHTLSDLHVDIPQTDDVEILTFADDTAITAFHCELNTAMQILQKGLNEIGSWTHTWRIKMNASKSTHMIFTGM